MSDVWAKRFPIVLATYWSVVATVYLVAVTFADIPAPNIRFADTIIGFVLGTVVATIINFFLGSSQGSKDKEDKIKEMTNDSTV